MKKYILALGLLGGTFVTLSGAEAHYAPYGSYLHSRYHQGFEGHQDGTTDHGYPTPEMIGAENRRTYRDGSYFSPQRTRYEEVFLGPIYPTGVGRNYPGRPWSSTGSY